MEAVVLLFWRGLDGGFERTQIPFSVSFTLAGSACPCFARFGALDAALDAALDVALSECYMLHVMPNDQVTNIAIPSRSSSLFRSTRKANTNAQVKLNRSQKSHPSFKSVKEEKPPRPTTLWTEHPELLHIKASAMAPSFDPLASNRSLNSVSSGGSSSISSRSKSKGKARDLGEVFLPPLPAQKQTFMPRSPSNNWSVEQQFDPSSRRRRRTGAGSRLGHDSEGLGLSEDEEDDVLSETRSFGSASLRHQSRPASPASSSSIPIITTNTADTQRPKTAPLLPRPRLEARIDRVMRPRNNTPSTPEVDSDEELMNVDRRPSRQMLSLAAALKESKVDDASKTPATPLRTSSSHAHSKSLTSKQFRRRSATATASSSPTTPVMDSPRKQKEEGWHVDIMVYARLPTSSMSMSASTSSFALDQLGGMINKPVFIKNVPADRKRSNTRRESAQVTLSPASPSSSDSRPRAGSSLNNSFTYGPCGPQSGAWGWRRAEAIVKDSGLLTIETLDVSRRPVHQVHFV